MTTYQQAFARSANTQARLPRNNLTFTMTLHKYIGNTMKTQHLGFSLIELMIVVSIIAILSMIALPSYSQYTKRARFSEVVAITDVYKLAVSLALQEGAAFTELSNETYGIPPSPAKNKHIESIVVENGIITATASKILDNATYILKPNTDGSQWQVSGSCVKNRLCHA